MSAPNSSSTSKTPPGEQAGREFAPRDDLLAALGEFSAAAGHEINNPLAVILGRVQLLLPGETDPARRQSLETIAGQAHRIRDMIGDLMLFANPPAPRLQTVNVADSLAPLIDNLIASRPPSSTIPPPQLDFTLPSDLRVQADPDQFRTVLAELLRNALHPTVAATRVLLHAEVSPVEPRCCLLTIRDNGHGLTPNEAVHLFNPFFSGRQAGRGLGFGLCKAWRLTTLQGGHIKVVAHGVDHDPGSENFATEFHLHWPLTSTDPENEN